jgi:hypothetical protein
MKAYRVSRGMSPLILNLGTRWEWAVNFMPRPLYHRERNPVPVEQEAGWTPELIWKFFVAIHDIFEYALLLGTSYWNRTVQKLYNIFINANKLRIYCIRIEYNSGSSVEMFPLRQLDLKVNDRKVLTCVEERLLYKYYNQWRCNFTDNEIISKMSRLSCKMQCSSYMKLQEVFWHASSVNWQIITDIPEKRSASIFRVKHSNLLGLRGSKEGTILLRNVGNYLPLETE